MIKSGRRGIQIGSFWFIPKAFFMPTASFVGSLHCTSLFFKSENKYNCIFSGEKPECTGFFWDQKTKGWLKENAQEMIPSLTLVKAQ